MTSVGNISTRAAGLDALRGLAIIGMVFSGVFPHESPWPAWMFHAQVGPPDFTYHPDVPGITWVDLVFPFFLFTMGASFPLALSRRMTIDKQVVVYTQILKRGVLLVFFAIALRHTNPGFLRADPWINYLTGLAVFVCFFLVFLRWSAIGKEKRIIMRSIGFILILIAIGLHHHYTPLEADLFKQDIIMLVLANMAVFGAVIWIFTVKNPAVRYGVLAFFAGIWLTRNVSGSFSEVIHGFHPALAWFYRFEFLKYLNIVIPGMFLGDLLLRFREATFQPHTVMQRTYLAFICAALLFTNLLGLFVREMEITLLADIILCLAGVWLLSCVQSGREVFLRKIFYWGIFWLFLGLIFEPLEGGIKKDPSSFSYWFVTSGLAFFAYIICEVIGTYRSQPALWRSVVHAGQNPMVAYVAGSFFILPVFYFSGVNKVFALLREASPFFGPLKSVAVTGCVVAVTSFTTRRQWFWRT